MSARLFIRSLAVLCLLAGPVHADEGDATPAAPAIPNATTALTAPDAPIDADAPANAPGAAIDAVGNGSDAPVPAAPAAVAAKTAPADAGPPTSPGRATAAASPATTRSGLEIYRSFREGLADPTCEPGASSRWRQHFAHAPELLAAPGNDVLPLFGYVVDRLREAYLPTEFALIPFIESGYRPGARSPLGPAGLWQFITVTARNHKVPIRAGYDGRLSPVDSTEAAVRYLKTLHGMFAGDWRLAVMAYNAGEYRLLGALRRAGQVPASADPDSLPMPSITRAYVRKLHALSCLFEEVEDRDGWLRSLDHQVPVLTAAKVPGQIATLEALADRHGADVTQLRRLNPVFGNGRIARSGAPRVLLPAAHASGLVIANTWTRRATPATPAPAPRAAGDISDAMADASAHRAPPLPRTHTVARGDSAWSIARHYGLRTGELLSRNRLDAKSVLRPGMVLAIDTVTQGAAAAAVAE